MLVHPGIHRGSVEEVMNTSNSLPYPGLMGDGKVTGGKRVMCVIIGRLGSDFTWHHGYKSWPPGQRISPTRQHSEWRGSSYHESTSKRERRGANSRLVTEYPLTVPNQPRFAARKKMKYLKNIQ